MLIMHSNSLSRVCLMNKQNPAPVRH